jgi:hypothetical protein
MPSQIITKKELVLMTNGGWTEHEEKYMGVHMCNSPNYPDKDPNRDRSLYNACFSPDFLLVIVKAVNCGEELLVDYNFADN